LTSFPKVPKTASESPENLFSITPVTPLSFDAPPGNPSEYPHKPYIARN